MVHDALREMEDKGTVPEESWMDGLKEAAGSAFLGTLFRLRRENLCSSVFLLFSIRDRTCQLHP